MRFLCGCILGSFLWYLVAHPSMFLYPAGVLQREPIVFLILQRSPSVIELWLWNYKTKQVSPGLNPQYCPAGLAILPNESGFSFIDNGILKVKLFKEKIPHIMPFDEPLHDISNVHWINNSCCYLSAKQRSHYGIFQVHMQGRVDPIILSSKSKTIYRQGIDRGYDCLYPQKVNNTLFYIERRKKVQQYYQVVSMSYPTIDYQKDKGVRTLAHNAKEEVFDFGEQAIAFLKMVSEREGYVVSFDQELHKESKIIHFSYHQLNKIDGEWKEKELFTFEIPSDFLFFDTDMRLYESMLPLLPRHIGDYIYFMNSLLGSRNLDIFRYNLQSKDCQQITFGRTPEEHYFAPIEVSGKLLYGGSFTQAVLGFIDFTHLSFFT